MSLISNTMLSLERGLNASSMQQQAISNNIANIDTPNYKARRVDFQSALTDAQAKLDAYRTDERHVPFSSGGREPLMKRDTDTAFNHNGNNVDLDHEMAMMANNQIYYNAVAERLNGQFSSLKTAIRGGN
ncbi:flagellar basal-body rod protein FlgB [Geomicrobium sp. JCM 19037]|uniref:flagellar basal body rod protein FlgB n=1 Tax=unclassified Geomicrobium TaxID=2628951 RepID=UPI00045F3C95|nr:flagellar basal body rod protein FlgB [Geomicrobium sp. JCM 19037]GAK02063.1 flagellar basal-body rod protein FlgB [Geomicrobium sp. JCM 19037]